jgi:hypothetical protein
MKLQASGSSNRESLQFQNRHSVKNRLSLNDFGRFSRATLYKQLKEQYPLIQLAVREGSPRTAAPGSEQPAGI